jgi:hypothetical protein
MKLRTKKRLLNLATAAIAAGALAIVARAWQSKPPVVIVDEVRSHNIAGADNKGAEADRTLSLDVARWNRILRQPLYDPPPPPKQEVIVEQRPITVKLVGTVIEPDNSQAFVRQASGAVELKRIGDAVSSDAADGVIASITPVEIVIRREDGEHHLLVERRN